MVSTAIEGWQRGTTLHSHVYRSGSRWCVKTEPCIPLPPYGGDSKDDIPFVYYERALIRFRYRISSRSATHVKRSREAIGLGRGEMTRRLAGWKTARKPVVKVSQRRESSLFEVKVVSGYGIREPTLDEWLAE